ncbi:TetR family transcriptional regulator [Pseudoclavibacter chungangensis]|uniref:TetR family transcriptional regulator n=1 Tax=Pseudoclavibacter chungangensis TaxID=587635 RepID=A0A7J5C085_9MICO|nr:TetR/AcrR family transcriptional regulator [Pseudoclavibacter chungangensis]KAB1660309.1 TetR family transcriptional regulator [Pseudoclavibacter chungangensis]NYJ65661.1 DNA-binding transcriptional regulator YbjK [Pseudoclavibacter chungangensis]
MAKNEARRNALADAGIVVLAREGSRGLTHRAIDQEAGVPVGTASNYFRSRDALVSGLADRIGARLAPTPDDLQRRGERAPGRALFADYLRDIVRRLMAEPDVTRALFELRLESGRRPELEAVFGPWLRAGFEADLAFNVAAGLPGGRREIALFRYAIDGFLLDRLTTPVDPDTSSDVVIDALVAGLLPD